MRKNHVLDSPITVHKYHKRQFTHYFCAGRGAGLGTGSSAGKNTRLSAGRRNVMRFFPYNTRKCESDPWKNKNLMNYTQYYH